MSSINPNKMYATNPNRAAAVRTLSPMVPMGSMPAPRAPPAPVRSVSKESCLQVLQQYLLRFDRKPSECRRSTSRQGQDDELIGWSPLAAAGGSWELLQGLAENSRGCASAVGAMLGLAIGDALGAPLEFLPVNPRLDYLDTSSVARNRRSCMLPTSNGDAQYQYECNKFRCKPGQWTDDTSMALCLADSLLMYDYYHGGDARVRWHMWWCHGYCNSFRHDRDRDRHTSIGLGGNISCSLLELEDHVPQGFWPMRRNHAEAVPATYTADTEDAGNGSIMRLAPVPIAFHGDDSKALKAASLQSYGTHPSSDASVCCQFMAFLIVRAIQHHKDGRHLVLQPFVEQQVRDFLTCPHVVETDSSGYQKLKALLTCRPPSPTEENWDWKRDQLAILEAIQARSGSYNGYPVIPAYFGSYCMDGLAMALWALWHSTDFGSCLIRAVNLLGDADTVAAIAGQMAGAIYGWQGIESDSLGNSCLLYLRGWDPRAEVGLRAAALFHYGPCKQSSGDASLMGVTSGDRSYIGGAGVSHPTLSRGYDPTSSIGSCPSVAAEFPSPSCKATPPSSVAPSGSAQARPVTLKQAENHPAVRVFAQPHSNAPIIHEVPNHTQMFAVDGRDSFVRVQSRKGSVVGWVGVKNIL